LGIKEPKIAVIGAGITGAACSNALKKSGLNPIIFEKSRGVGGRLTTRRTDEHINFDHGVQFITGRSDKFKKMLIEFSIQDTAEVWKPRLADDLSVPHESWFVGKPTMSSLIKPLLENIKINLSDEISVIKRSGSQWCVESKNEPRDSLFDNVICTVPAPQARTLLSMEKELIEKIAEVTISPCWALMVAYDFALELDFDVWRSETEDISWVSLNSSKPGRNSDRDCWVAHASPEWSENNIELSRKEVIKALLNKLCMLFGNKFASYSYITCHRWRYARTLKPLNRPYLVSDDGSLFLGGDWCLGSRVECGFESGVGIANDLIKNL
jgi:renalase